MMKGKTIIAIVFLVMFLFAPLKAHGVFNKEKVDNNDFLMSKRDLNGPQGFDLPSRQPTVLYEDHGRIEIYNDSAFDLYGFNGSGNSTHPYLIENYNITDSSGILIHIENTTARFLIKDCYLNGTGASSDGIVLTNVTHGTVHKNTICDTVERGIFLENSSKSTLTDNTIYDCESGIELLSISYNNTLSGNTIYNCSSYGIHLDSSYYCSISGNPVYNCSNGIQLEGADNNTLSGNTIYDCSTYGIDLVQSSKNNTLTGNTIYNCSGDGIRLNILSNKNAILSNIIYNCSANGIRLHGSSSYNNITGNTIHNCSGNGTHIYIFPNTVSHTQNNTV
ncbi:MAG: right-handed parallel beta-helix repeat-containing protein, partial [Candidatus Hodarchaeales archaeon]